MRCLLLVLLFSFGMVNSQFYNNGQNSSSVKWRSIDLEFCEIIFPLDFEPKAQELANILVRAEEYASEDLKTKNKKISIIVQSNTTVANGFVTLAPWRSELYSVPGQENEGVDWLNKLAIHEYRHVIQIEKFNQGVGKVLYYLFGEQGIGALVLATTPLWFIEGDAVDIETKNTVLGRGKYGPFIRELKAQLFELDSLSYEKCSFGSYKEHITDHYKIGYFLVDHIKRNYGDSIADTLLRRITRNPFVPYPFSYHLKKITGKTTPEIYADLVRDLKGKWKPNGKVEKEYLTPLNKRYTSYENPVIINDSEFVCLKKSYDHPIEFVKFVDGFEKRLTLPGRYDMNSLSYSSDKLVWSEKRRDVRWEYRDYSEVILFDLKTKKRNRIKKRTKWFAPSLNMKGDKIALVEQSKSYNSSLRIIDLKGEVLSSMELLDGILYHPSWYRGQVYFVQLLNGVSTVYKWSVDDQEIESVFKTQEPISYPQLVDSSLVFQTSVNGEDQILSYKNGKFYSLVKPEFGLQFPKVNNQEIYYADYHSQGMRIVKSELKEQKEIQLSQMEFKNTDLPKDSFQVDKYYPLLHLFNMHSWAPVSIYPSDQNVKMGLSLFSQNKLSSSTAKVNYDYDWINKGEKFSTSYTFSRFYPVMFASYSFEDLPNSIVLDTKTNFKQEVFQAGSRVSLGFDGSSYVKRLLFQGVFVHSKNHYDFEDTYRDTILKSENVQLLAYFSTSLRRGKRNIISRWNFSIQGKYFGDLNRSESALMFKSTVSTPGFYKNHGVRLSYSDQKSTSIFVANYIGESRGYINHSYQEARKASFDYFFPIIYPDFKIGKLAYVQRIRGQLFADYMIYNDGRGFEPLKSYGLELNMEFNPFRYSYLTQLGVEIAMTENQGVFVSPIFRILY